MPILVRFWDITRYWQKIADLNLPHLYLAPLLGWCGWNFDNIFCIRKLESLDYRMALLVWSLYHSDLWQRDRRSDGQTHD